MNESTPNIHKLVSLTFDADPEVRKQAAEMLGATDDPAAVFALVELSYDKEPTVRDIAQQQLEKRKQTEPELMSFAKIFSSGSKKTEKKKPVGSREKVLGPITQIFEKKLGKEKAEAVKDKMMPTIEKIYQKAVSQKSGDETTDDNGRKAMQEFLTSYLEVMSDINSSNQIAPTVNLGETATIVTEAGIVETGTDVLSTELDEVGKLERLDNISSEIATLEMQYVEEEKKHEEIESLPDTFFKKAYEVMMLSAGDEKIMKREQKRMIDTAKREITLAFQLAKDKFKATKITHISDIKDKMRNINSDPLRVISVENKEYQKTKKTKAAFTRVVVNDEEGNEGLIYLFDDRGTVVQPNMKIKIIKGMAKTFKFSGETALTLGKKSNVYIVL